MTDREAGADRSSGEGGTRRAARTGAFPSHGALVAALAFAAGCSDGSSGPGGGTNLPGTILADNGPETRLNGAVYAIDPATGIAAAHALPLPNGEDGIRYDGGAEFLVGGSGPDPVLTLGVNDCLTDERYADELYKPACLERIGADGSVERLFTLPGSTWFAVPPVLSPDGTLVAAVTSPRFTVGPYTLTLFTPRGETVASQVLGRRFVDGPFAIPDWAPGNRLVYAYRREGEGTFVLMSAPGSLVPEAAWQVSVDGSESVGSISVGPDGALIAYDVIAEDADSSERDVRVLTVATGESVLAAVGGSDGPRPRLGDPEWSPDGRHLLVRYGESASGGSAGSVLPFMMVVEWRGETVTLDPYEGVGQVLVTDSTATGVGYAGPREQWVYGRTFWVEGRP